MARWGNGKLPWRGKGFREQIERYRCPAVGTDGLPREKLPSQRGGAGWITPTLKHHAQLPELQKLLGAFGNESRIRNPFAGSRGSFVSTVCSGLPLPSIVHISFHCPPNPRHIRGWCLGLSGIACLVVSTICHTIRVFSLPGIQCQSSFGMEP